MPVVPTRPYLKVQPNFSPAPGGHPLPPQSTPMSKSNEQIQSPPRSMDGKSGYGLDSKRDTISFSLSFSPSLSDFLVVCCSCLLSFALSLFFFFLFCVWNHHQPPQSYPSRSVVRVVVISVICSMMVGFMSGRPPRTPGSGIVLMVPR